MNNNQEIYRNVEKTATGDAELYVEYIEKSINNSTSSETITECNQVVYPTSEENGYFCVFLLSAILGALIAQAFMQHFK